MVKRGKGGSLTSCDAILKRVENNDPKLTELIILPMKTFGPDDLERLSKAIGKSSFFSIMIPFCILHDGYYYLVCATHNSLTLK